MDDMRAPSPGENDVDFFEDAPDADDGGDYPTRRPEAQARPRPPSPPRRRPARTRPPGRALVLREPRRGERGDAGDGRRRARVPLRRRGRAAKLSQLARAARRAARGRPAAGPRLGGLDIAGLAHRPETSPAPSRSAAPAGRRRDRAELKPPRKALFLDLLSFTERIGTTRHFRVPGGRGGLSIPPSSFLKGGHMHRR
ncbi:hypothetical protein JL720_5415 [Aureococcus anophagefferens]|nr:hypothetical protein JL720_5415 [Aureococcus anophagefferens]